MNQRFVEAFYWVATLKSMTRAAEKLFMTQSAIPRTGHPAAQRDDGVAARVAAPSGAAGADEHAPHQEPRRDDEVPVFWGCGVTPQWVAQRSGLPLCVTHAPGKMFVTDLKG